MKRLPIVIISIVSTGLLAGCASRQPKIIPPPEYPVTKIEVAPAGRWNLFRASDSITIKAAGEFAKENLNVAAQYTQLITGGDIASENELTPGSGAVIREGVKKLACYRDPDGTLYKMSAICPHLQCVVQWNTVENTWDCPCHGSRFEATGKVLNGPALGGLSRGAVAHACRPPRAGLGLPRLFEDTGHADSVRERQRVGSGLRLGSAVDRLHPAADEDECRLSGAGSRR